LENVELRASGDADGRIVDWTRKQLLGVPDRVGISKLCLSGKDCNIRSLSSIAGKSFSFESGDSLSIESAPFGFISTGVVSPGVEAFVTSEAVIYKSAEGTKELKLTNTPITNAIITPSGTICYADSKKHIRRIAKGNHDHDLDLEGVVGKVTALAVDSQEQLLAAGDDQRRITIFDFVSGRQIATKWCHHSSTISALAWSPDRSILVSGGLDNHLFVWSTDSAIKPIGQACSTIVFAFFNLLFRCPCGTHQFHSVCWL